MSATLIYRKLRDTLVDWGWVARPRFYLRRQRVGAVRASLMGRGSSRRMRRTSLQRLLRM